VQVPHHIIACPNLLPLSWLHIPRQVLSKLFQEVTAQTIYCIW
jgi:hypothetical protein